MKFFNSFSFLIITFIFVLIFSLCFFIPAFSEYGYISNYIPSDFNNSIDINSFTFFWPTPSYSTITSKFGYRNAPTAGASSYHGGIDIAAPAGSNIIATCSGSVSFTGFSGAGGYTVTIKSSNLSISYCHVSPNFLVYVGQSVNKGDIIAKVGPKNVYDVPNNPYKDSNGNPTNRSNYRSSFTFCNKKRRQSRQSIGLFLKIQYIFCILIIHFS